MQEFHDAGMVWLANRALHPFGYALMVTAVVGEDGSWTVIEERGLQVVKTDDPMGMMYDEDTENRSRERFFGWLRKRALAQQLFGGEG